VSLATVPAECNALARLAAHRLEPAHIREHLNREVPVRHAPVHLEVREFRLEIVKLHALNHHGRLEFVYLERRACDVCRCGVRRQADQEVRRAGVQIWRQQTREGSHEVDTWIGGHRVRKRVDLLALLIILIEPRSHLIGLLATATSRVSIIT
jgi:hypothetical protein